MWGERDRESYGERVRLSVKGERLDLREGEGVRIRGEGSMERVYG